MHDAHLTKLFNSPGCDVRQIQEGALVEPLTLNQHLQQIDQIDCIGQGALVCCDIDHTLQYADGLVKHRLTVCDKVSYWKGTSVEVRLQQKISFNVRTL